MHPCFGCHTGSRAQWLGRSYMMLSVLPSVEFICSRVTHDTEHDTRKALKNCASVPTGVCLQPVFHCNIYGVMLLPVTSHWLHGQLRGQNAIALFDGDAVTRELVIRGKTSWTIGRGPNSENQRGHDGTTHVPGWADLVILPSSVNFWLGP